MRLYIDNKPPFVKGEIVIDTDYGNAVEIIAFCSSSPITGGWWFVRQLGNNQTNTLDVYIAKQSDLYKASNIELMTTI